MGHMIRRTFRQGDYHTTSTTMVDTVDLDTVASVLDVPLFDRHTHASLADDLWNWGTVDYGWLTLTLTKSGPFSTAYAADADSDGAPCCYGNVTSGGSDHEPDCYNV